MTEQQEYNRKLIEEFRAARGTVGGPLAGRPLVLLTTIGARSGQPRTTPMMYVRNNEHLLVIASNLGAPAHPDWYHNLVANPNVTVEIGDETFASNAVVMAGAERQRLWTEITEAYPFFNEHQAKTKRQIPVVALERQNS
ncbi:MAG: nitroreductase family deazaflavin-dependent oxidoreductase [Chloroflexi bacterium]|nr:nitroreductase family deazaflavin-dependent oxidoreductase [Chloroflexota bacterium]